MGDPAGIGPEICVHALQPGNLPAGIIPILVGDSALLRQVAGPELPEVNPASPGMEVRSLREGSFYLYDLLQGGELVEPGRATSEGGSASVAYLRGAIELVKAGLADGIVTAPISKEAWRMAGVRHPGHTEFLREATGSRRTAMMFVGGGLRVALFTTHVSIAEARKALDIDALVDFIDFVVRELRRYGMTELRVAVAGFNPHAGEGGLFGDEEVRIISPAVEECRRRGLNVSGPLPADTLFSPPARQRYDLAVTLYHDQGLIPIKAIAFGSAVNVTLGLPFVRTSPPHGVAYDITRSGKASAEGLVAAISTAAELVSRRGEERTLR
jgi:4-hydroxythreonine-4-phosphate dehydrogenase